jgi:adenylate cyclase
MTATDVTDAGVERIEAPAWRPTPTVAWMIEEGWRIDNAVTFVDELCASLLADGIPLFRLSVLVRTLHPQIYGDAFYWRRAEGRTDYRRFHHADFGTPEFTNSPAAVSARLRCGVRWRIAEAGVGDEIPLLVDLRKHGATDYIVLPLKFRDASNNFLTAATDRPGGFAEREIGDLAAMCTTLGRVGEAQVLRRFAARLLNVYVGADAGERILQGTIQRGSATTLRAAIWLCDLRDFTSLSDRLPRDVLIALLNGYFDRLAEPVHARGGQVLKFMGDGMLAIFPVPTEAEEAAVCAQALDAAREAVAAMARWNAERQVTGEEALGFGIALHIGEVSYGNIGATYRLDFTVIGPAVNWASRIECLTRPLGVQLLVSAAFAQHVPAQVSSVGRHALAGIAEPQELFTPA